MFLSWLQLDALLSHHWELLRLADEQIEGQVLLVEAAKGDGVRVKIQDEPQPILPTHLILYLLSPHLLDQRLVFRSPQRVYNIEGLAHAGIGGHPREQVGTVELRSGQFTGEQHVFLTSEAGQR